MQQPRIPVWVAGRWPNRRPFRRAARWDGMFPIFEGVGARRCRRPAALAEAVRYTLRAARRDDGAVRRRDRGAAAEDRAADARWSRAYAAAGLTWWVEKLGWFRGPLDAMRARVAAGPPRG